MHIRLKGAVRRIQAYARRGVVQLVRHEPRRRRLDRVEHTVVLLRKYQPPVAALGALWVHLVQCPVRCVRVGVQKQTVAGEERMRHSIHSHVDGDEPAVWSLAVQAVDLAANPALLDLDSQPAAAA